MSSISNISVSAAPSYATVGSQNQQSLQPFANLDLTEAQRTALRAIFTAAKQNGSSPAEVRQQLNAVLTPTQQQKLASDLKAGKSGHHGHHAADSAPEAAAAPNETAPASSATLTDEAVPEAVANVQKQAVAAQSTLIANLQKSLLGTDQS